MEEVKIYVSTKGSDSNSGTKTAPVATPEKAVEKAIEARKNGAKVTVLFAKGEYKTQGFEIPEELNRKDHQKVYFKAENGEVIISGGKTLDINLFKPVTGEDAKRLFPAARKHVYVCDLTEAGIAPEEVCKRDQNGNLIDESRAEVFVNGQRKKWAGYPNDGYCKFEEIIEEFDKEGRGGTVVLDKTVNMRAKRWQFKKDFQISGYFKYDWASDSTLVEKIDTEKSQLKILTRSGYGLARGGLFKLSNIYEELDSPDECYLDRENNRLFIYVDGDIKSAKVKISLARNNIMTLTRVSYLSFEGITFEGSRKRAIVLDRCRKLDFINCKIRNVSEWGLSGSGNNIHIDNCEVYHTGFGGMTVTGGDRRTLTSSGNIIENCYVHDWSEIKPTYGAGIEICGCGSIVRHNELARCPHLAIYYDGNEHLIEYNYIHEAVQHSHDMGAIYGGRDWAAYGTVIRYNMIENSGNKEYFPVGIYWDDTLSGQTAYGNIIKKSYGQGMLIGGGRDNKVFNNIFIDCTDYCIQFDKRGEDWNTDWADVTKPGSLINQLRSYDLHNGVWHDKFPVLEKIHTNRENYEDEYFYGHPARAEIINNLFIFSNGRPTVYRGMYGCLIDPLVYKYGVVRDNALYKTRKECLKKNTYDLNDEAKKLLHDFENIPYQYIGRKKK